MALPDRVDVVVAGAGVAGVRIARRLAERGTSVLLAGPPGPDDVPLLHVGLGEHPARLLASLGPDRCRELLDLAAVSARLLGVPLQDQVWAAVTPTEPPLVPASVDALRTLGFDAEILDAAGLKARGFTADTGFVLRDGLAVVPEALATPAVTAGPVDRVDEDAGGLEVVLGPDRVRAELVVVTDGRTGERLSAWFADKTVPVREQALWLAGPPVAGRAGHGWTSVRPWRGGVAIAGCRWATPHLEVGETDAVPVPAVQERLEAFARTRLGLHGRVLGRKAWIEDHACDGLPIVGPVPGRVRWVACLGHGGAAWSLGPATAEMVVDGVLGGPTGTPAMFAPSRFVG
jgi:glycine oxidase